MKYLQFSTNLCGPPHHCADTSDIFGSSIGDPNFFCEELYDPLSWPTLFSYPVDALSVGLDWTKRIAGVPSLQKDRSVGEARAESSLTDAHDMTFSTSFPSSIMESAPLSEGPRIFPECPAIVPNVTSQPDTAATPCTRDTLLPRALNSSTTSNEITACDNTSSESIQEELSTCCTDAIRPQICPPGYRKKSFPSEMTQKLIRGYNIPDHHVFYYWRDQDRDDHTCPLNCGQRFIGEFVRAHLERFHPNINSRSRKYVCCRTQSHSKSKCPPKNSVQERYFLKHFTVMHSLAHSLCPFCLGRQTRVDHLYRHFAVCRVLRVKN
ncbi:hypothetical protein IW261DRAFT_1470548 [Armillaria novae-zelandiae]|uniref:Uncharacterized protein n=1 Tax=Armillaria novae-zelandiae TaxID=153914 RepID=A0AA39PC09_9AGAR|nr:hypothetical protein IW261DRAFT_1470548 [Armillaria novae-zelandiae]